jgi:hypothetical protein
LWKLKKKISTTEQTGQLSERDDTNRRVGDVIDHYTQSARGDLSEGGVTVPKLFNQESVIAEQICSLLRAREGGDRIGLVVGVGQLQ